MLRFIDEKGNPPSCLRRQKGNRRNEAGDIFVTVKPIDGPGDVSPRLLKKSRGLLFCSPTSWIGVFAEDGVGCILPKRLPSGGEIAIYIGGEDMAASRDAGEGRAAWKKFTKCGQV